jgi:FkbM family methyltransferase
MTRGSGNVETMYDRVADLGFLWTALMSFVRFLGVDEVIFAPAKSKLVPVPLFMTTSEKCVKDVFRPEEGDVVVDVGAYIGRHTLIASKRVGKSGKVIAIEPDPKNFEILKHNVQANQLTNVVLLSVAASNREGFVRLYLGDSGGWSSSFVVTGKQVDVPCSTLDALLEKLGIEKVDWMKVDVEGAALAVLDGSTRLLRRSRNLKVIVEIHPNVCEERQVISLLERSGYQVRNLEPLGEMPYHIQAYRCQARVT